MQKINYLFILFFIACLQCGNKDKATTVISTTSTFDGKSIKNITLPTGYKRINTEENSFEKYLQSIKLKSDKTVYLYNGQKKYNQDAQYAVLNISVGDRDLQQCADAVMRLRAEYFYQQKKYDSILFVDNENIKYKFEEPFTRANFDKYLLKVFGMCGSASLEKQLQPKSNLNDIKIGDVWIKGGFPGHAVIVVDVAQNDAGEKIFMIAQSYMPAQNIHLLKNPNNDDYSPWYTISDIEDTLVTPEYTFTKNQLRTW